MPMGIYRQIVPPTAGQPDKKPMLIPLAVGLLNSSGQDLPLSLVYDGESSIDLKVDGNPVKTAVLRIEKVMMVHCAFILL